MSAFIFLEGGGNDSKELHVRCREAFRKLLEKCGFKRRLPRLFASGGRSTVFDDFCTEHSNSTKDDYVAMWIDSEEPLSDIEAAWQHLATVKTVPKWAKPAGAIDDQVLFMTTCMETYIVADHATLKKHFGSKLHSPVSLLRTRRTTFARLYDDTGTVSSGTR